MTDKYELPPSGSLDISTFSRLLDDTTNSYKSVFFLSLLDILSSRFFNVSLPISLNHSAVEMLVNASTKEHSYGREEIRHYLMLNELGHQLDPEKKWGNLQSIGMVESVRMVNGKTTVETRYYISSLPNNAQALGESVRSHWGIENPLHCGGVSAEGSFPPQNLLY